MPASDRAVSASSASWPTRPTRDQKVSAAARQSVRKMPISAGCRNGPRARPKYSVVGEDMYVGKHAHHCRVASAMAVRPKIHAKDGQRAKDRPQCPFVHRRLPRDPVDHGRHQPIQNQMCRRLIIVIVPIVSRTC